MGRRHRIGVITLAIVALLAQPALAETKGAPQDKDAKAKPKRQRVVSRLDGFELTAPAELARQASLEGASRGGARPRLLAPALGKVFGEDLAFAWTYTGRAEGYVFKLLDAEQTEIFNHEVAGREFAYPDGGPALERGKTYYWSVAAKVPGRSQAASRPAGLKLVDSDERARIERRIDTLDRSNFYAYALGRARVFRDARLWYDALAAYATLASHYPSEPEAFEERGQIYAQLSQTRDLAQADFDRADSLQEGAEAAGTR